MMNLTLVYFAGVLIQFSQLEPSDAANLGILLILLFVTMVGSVLVVVLLEFRAVAQWRDELKYALAEMSSDPLFDHALHEYLIEPEQLQLGKVLGQGTLSPLYPLLLLLPRTPPPPPPPPPPSSSFNFKGPKDLYAKPCTGAWKSR
jgi:hypothetical protein